MHHRIPSFTNTVTVLAEFNHDYIIPTFLPEISPMLLLSLCWN